MSGERACYSGMAYRARVWHEGPSGVRKSSDTLRDGARWHRSRTRAARGGAEGECAVRANDDQAAGRGIMLRRAQEWQVSAD